MDRRSAIRNIILLATAPAIIKIDMLMPVKFQIDTKSIYGIARQSGKSYTIRDLYYYLQYVWDNEPEMIGFKFPLQHSEDVSYALQNNWTIGEKSYNQMIDGRM